MLRHLLNSHPEIRCHGEVMAATGLASFVASEDDLEETRRLRERLSSEEPRRFLEEFVFAANGARAVGFKVKYEELVREPFFWLLDWLRSHPEVRVVRMRRENALKRYISQVLSTKVYGVYNIVREEERPAPRRIRLTPEECLADFRQLEDREALFGEYFRGHSAVSTTYESLLADREGTLRDVVGFLGLDAAPLATPTLKLNPDDLRDLIENLDELAIAFRDTPYARYFPG